MAAINRLNTQQQMNSIMRRFFMVRLLAHQKEIDKPWGLPTAPAAPSGTKWATWMINQMMSQIDPSVIHPVQQSREHQSTLLPENN